MVIRKEIQVKRKRKVLSYAYPRIPDNNPSLYFSLDNYYL